MTGVASHAPRGAVRPAHAVAIHGMHMLSRCCRHARVPRTVARRAAAPAAQSTAAQASDAPAAGPAAVSEAAARREEREKQVQYLQEKLGMSEAEARQELLEEELMTETDPEGTTLDGKKLEDLFSIDENVPEDVKGDLLAPGHGPPVRVHSVVLLCCAPVGGSVLHKAKPFLSSDTGQSLKRSFGRVHSIYLLDLLAAGDGRRCPCALCALL